MIIAIDFDGACTTHEFPKIGKDIGAVPVLKALVAKGHNLILFTMRSDRSSSKLNPLDTSIDSDLKDYLTQAIKWFEDNEIKLHSAQVNPSQKFWTTSPKCYADLYIDDAGLGIPLLQNTYLGSVISNLTNPTQLTDDLLIGRPYVDWIRTE